MGIYVGNGWMVHSSARGTTLVPMVGWYETSFAWGRSPLAEAGLAAWAAPRRLDSPSRSPYDRAACRTCPRPTATSGCPTAARGRSGLQLPAVSLGLWWNFGHDRAARDEPRDRPPRVRPRDHALRPREQLRAAVRVGRGELRPAPRARTCGRYRDELVVSTKAGYDMWPGPYGEWGSRKYLLASLDQSLARMGLDYVDIFYSHRFDPETPLEETMGALDTRRAAGQGAVRRDLLVLGGEDARGGRDPARASARRFSSTSRRTRC